MIVSFRDSDKEQPVSFDLVGLSAVLVEDGDAADAADGSN